MSFPTLLARQCHNCSFKLRENDVYMAIERPLKIKINAEDAHKLESRDNFFQITWHYFSDHVLKIEALRSKISSGTFTSLMILMVGTFVLAKGEVHRATRLYYISTKHSPDRVVEQCFGIHISHPWTVWLEICCDEELPTQKNKLSFPILDIRKSLKYHFPDDR